MVFDYIYDIFEKIVKDELKGKTLVMRIFMIWF